MEHSELTDEAKEQAREREAEGGLGALSEEDFKEGGTGAQLPLDDLDSATGGQVAYMCFAPEHEERSQMPQDRN